MTLRLVAATIGMFLLLGIYVQRTVFIRQEEYRIKELIDACEALEAENRLLTAHIEQLRSFARLERAAAERGFEPPTRQRGATVRLTGGVQGR